MNRNRVATAAPATAAEPPAAEPTVVARWRERLDTLTRWCLADFPLAPAVADALPAARPQLGDLLRRALGRDGAGVVDLLDALDALATPAARALVGRVLGGDLLLVVVTVRDGALARADARACRTPIEARALVDAFLGSPSPGWVAEFGVADADGTRTPALASGIDGQPFDGRSATVFAHEPGGETTIVLPFLPLDRPPAAAAPDPTPDAAPAFNAFAAPAILGGTLRPGAAFLDVPASAEDDEDTDEPDARWNGRDLDNEDAESDAEDDDEDAEPDADDAPRHDPSTDPFAVPDAWAAAAFAPAPGSRAGTAGDAVDDVAEPEVDHGGALDRLRARTSAAVERVSVLIATDDGVAEHVADAAAWLADASEQELRALARGGWTGDAAVEVALALAEDDPEALDVVQLARRHEAELVVEIDGRAAAAWLESHRPDAARRLGALLK